MTIYNRPIKELMDEFAKQYLKEGQEFSNREAVSWFKNHYPRLSPNTVRINVNVMAVNSGIRKHHPSTHKNSNHDLFYQIRRGRYRLWNKEEDPEPIYSSDIIGESTGNNSNDDVLWTHQELVAAVQAYLQMLEFENLGKNYSKKDFNEILRSGALSKRTRSSIEYRMQNISTVLEELCLPRIKGYQPAKNIGTNVSNRIKDILQEVGYIDAEDYATTEDSNLLDKRVAKLRKNLSNTEPRGNKSPKKRSSPIELFERDPLIKAWVLEKAENTCECCSKEAPFYKASGEPYLEVHHVITLAEGGSDTTDNTIAVCPNCHRELHFGENSNIMKNELYKKIERLKKGCW